MNLGLGNIREKIMSDWYLPARMKESLLDLLEDYLGKRQACIIWVVTGKKPPCMHFSVQDSSNFKWLEAALNLVEIKNPFGSVQT